MACREKLTWRRDADVLGVNVAQGDVHLEIERVEVVPHRVLAIRDEEVGVQRFGEEIGEFWEVLHLDVERAGRIFGSHLGPLVEGVERWLESTVRSGDWWVRADGGELASVGAGVEDFRGLVVRV